MEEARHYGYSQIHIEDARKKFIVIAFAIQRFEIKRSLDNRPTQKHGTSSNEGGIVAAFQRFFAFTQHILSFAPKLFGEE